MQLVIRSPKTFLSLRLVDFSNDARHGAYHIQIAVLVNVCLEMILPNFPITWTKVT